MAADRFSMDKNWDAVSGRHIGTGSADHTKFEWLQNQHRDTLASNIGHSDMLRFVSVATNESVGRVRYNMLEKMLQPCGPPPPAAGASSGDGKR